MTSVDEARNRILDGLRPVGRETIPALQGLGRVVAQDLTSRRTQPPADVSAMDGYAVRSRDVSDVPTTLKQVMEIAAGGQAERAIGPGECARIFTGAPLPEGADAIVIQEDTRADGTDITVLEGVPPARYVRKAGLDFREGDLLIRAGEALNARAIGLVAAMNRPWIDVFRKPRVAILATGDEIVLPGEDIGPSQIVSSNGPALAACVAACGGEATLLPVAHDDAETLKDIAASAAGFDLLLTTGGASVGKHDLVGSALTEIGLSLDFWKIAMRPGKPLMFGMFGDGDRPVPMLGLPGNPVSAIVCFILFGVPALRKLGGQTDCSLPIENARLGAPLPENDNREEYLRGTLRVGEDGVPVATGFDKQDSSMLHRLCAADCLIRRAARASPAAAGETVEIIRFSNVVGAL